MKNNQQIPLLPINNAKNKTIKLYNGAQVKWIAITTAAVVALGSYAVQKATFKPYVPNSITITDENSKQLAADMVFDANSNQEMIDRISSVYVDALTKGIKNISIEQWTDFYIILNINDIDPTDYARLQFSTKTKESMMRNFDFVNNTLLDDTITSTPKTVIDIASLVANKESAAAITALQEKIAEFNTSSSKSTVAGELNKFVESEFATEIYNQVDAPSNLVRFKLLLAMERMTVNNSYRVPSADMSKIIFGKGEDCNLTSKSTVNTKYNGEKTTVKEMLGAKLEKARTAKTDDPKISAIELLAGFEIEMKIKEKIAAQDAKYIANPSVEEAILANKPQTSTPSSQKVQPNDKIVTDKKTGETFIAVDPSVAQKEQQEKQIKDQLEKENQNENLRAAGVVDGGQAGYDDGFIDGYGVANYNDNFGTIAGDKIYRDAYKESYIKQYKSGYTDGKLKHEREQNNIIKEEIVPLPQYDQNNDGKVDYNPNLPTTNNNNNSNEKPQDVIIEETYEAAPGYHYENGVLIDDSTGLPVKTTSSRESTIEELKNLRVVAVNIKNTDITISNEGKTARM